MLEQDHAGLSLNVLVQGQETLKLGIFNGYGVIMGNLTVDTQFDITFYQYFDISYLFN